MIKKLRLIENKILLNEKLPRSLATISQEEYDSLTDELLELIDEIQPVDYSTDLDARIAKIKADRDDPEKTKELMDEDETYMKPVKDARKALRAKEREQQRYQKRLASSNQNRLRDDIYETIADQVRKYEEEVETWQVLNRRYEDDPNMVVKGHRIEEFNRLEVPSIEVFLDYSVSWDKDDLIKGRAVIEDLQEFVDDGKLKLNIFYFTDDIATTPEGARAKGSSTSGWGHIVNQILASGTKNVMIMTDSDMNTWGDHSKKVLVDGCVWYLWKNGVKAPNLPNEVKGRMGTIEYNLI
jgi:hypothetical protein